MYEEGPLITHKGNKQKAQIQMAFQGLDPNTYLISKIKIVGYTKDKGKSFPCPCVQL